MDQPLQELRDARLLRSPKEVARFDGALASLATEQLDVDRLGQLHLVLDDATGDYEVMFGLVHLLEDAPAREQLAALLSVLPRLTKQAPEWTKILHFRILNDPSSRAVYRDLLAKADVESRSLGISILREIAESEVEPLAGLALSLLPAK